MTGPTIVIEQDETGEELAVWPPGCHVPKFADFVALKEPLGLYQVDRVLWVYEQSTSEQRAIVRVAKVNHLIFFKEKRPSS